MNSCAAWSATPPLRFQQFMARALLTQVLLAQGRAAEAREVAALGVQRLEQAGSEGAEAVGLRLALAEASAGARRLSSTPRA
jgi:hypothetical protein